MEMVHELPGTTFSSPAERGDYDSDATNKRGYEEIADAFQAVVDRR